MKIGDEEYKKLSAETRQELERVDVTEAIIRDEFYNKQKGDYRRRAVERLVKMKIPFYNERNIIFEMTKAFVKLLCPYCKTEMHSKLTGTGAGEYFTSEYHCGTCDATATITLESGGLRFYPKGEQS